MAIIWIDGYDHYGSTGANLTAGAYAANTGSCVCKNSFSRTGGWCLSSSGSSSANLRKALGSSITAVGIGWSIYFPSLPGTIVELLKFNDASNGNQLTVWLNTTGTIRVTRGTASGTNILGETASPAISNGSWNHLEIKATFSNTTGTVEIRANEAIVLNLTGLDTVATANVECSQIEIFPTPTSSASGGIDDMFIWDTSGTENNDFIGDRRVIMLSPSANEATQEWTASSGSAYAAIDDTAPDGDTTYIEADDAVPVTSEFALTDAAATVGAIAAVQTVVCARRVEAVSTVMQVSLLSGGDVDAGASHSIGDAYAYYTDISELNPDTGAPWTRTALNAATLRLRRTT